MLRSRSVLFSTNDTNPDFVKMVRTILIVLMFASFGIVISSFLSNGSVAVKVTLSSIALLAGISLFITFQGVLWPAKLFLPLAGLVASTFLAIRANGMHDTAIVGFSLVIIVASLMSGQRAIPYATFLTMLGIGAVAYADMTGINDSVLASATGWNDVAVMVFLQLMVAGSLNALMTIFSRTVEAQVEVNQELRKLQSDLERRVEERTKALSTSAEVSRRLSTILDPNQLVSEVVEQIKDAFNYYHAHIYLVEEATGDLVMVGGTGEAGKAMLDSNHRIPAGKGIVGRVAETNKSVLVSDTSQDENWLPNPLLPETKSELAVPISLGLKVLGVLDVQQNQVNGLSSDDEALIQSIAYQVAVALENAQTYSQTQKQAERATIINDISRKIQNTSTVEQALQVAVRELGKTLGVRESRIMLDLPDSVLKDIR